MRYIVISYHPCRHVHSALYFHRLDRERGESAGREAHMG